VRGPLDPVRVLRLHRARHKELSEIPTGVVHPQVAKRPAPEIEHSRVVSAELIIGLKWRQIGRNKPIGHPGECMSNHGAVLEASV
jgi:hypothetical protein